MNLLKKKLMKLKKNERYHSDTNKLYYRWFEDTPFNSNDLTQGYASVNWEDGTESRLYWVNQEKIGMEICEDTIHYHI